MIINNSPHVLSCQEPSGLVVFRKVTLAKSEEVLPSVLYRSLSLMLAPFLSLRPSFDQLLLSVCRWKVVPDMDSLAVERHSSLSPFLSFLFLFFPGCHFSAPLFSCTVIMLRMNGAGLFQQMAFPKEKCFSLSAGRSIIIHTRACTRTHMWARARTHMAICR